MNQNLKVALRYAAVLLLTAVVSFAQTSAAGVALKGLTTEIVSWVHWAGVIGAILCGFGILFGGPGAVAKVGGLVGGLALALFAESLVTFVSGLA